MVLEQQETSTNIKGVWLLISSNRVISVHLTEIKALRSLNAWSGSGRVIFSEFDQIIEETKPPSSNGFHSR